MGSNVFNIAVSGLNAAQAGLVTSGHNIANLNTPSFHRQQAVQTSGIPQQTGAGYFGQGVQIETVQRIYSDFLDNQILQAQTEGSYLDTYAGQIQQINNMLADTNSGLSPALQEFFSSVQDVASNPTSIPSRQVLISDGQNLVSRFRNINQRLQDIRGGVNNQITSIVTSINATASKIASMNQQILLAQTGNQPNNDLLDKRDALIADLNQYVRTSIVKQSDGTYNILIGSGQSLVVGNQASTLTTTTSPDDPQKLSIGFVVGSTTALLDSNTLTGGSLGALLSFRTNTLDTAQNQLGRVAIALAQTFNDQHRLGQDLTGTLGANFFNVASPTVISNTSNTGTAVIGAAIASVNSLTTSDYQLSYSGGTYTLVKLSDNTTTTYATLPQTVDGITISLSSGAVANGDKFLIQPTRAGARDISMSISDNTRIAAAAPIRTASASANTGSATVSAGVVNGPPPTNANLQQTVTITFTAANTFDVSGTGTGNPTGVAYTSGGNITYNGWTIQITGTPRTGDVFTVSSNTSGVGDNRNALLLSALQTQNTMAGSTASYQGAYSQLVSGVGNTARQIDVQSKAQDALIVQTKEAQQAMSGVNLDEEAANLIRYQQLYQASGKVIQVASKLFDVLLDAAG